MPFSILALTLALPAPVAAAASLALDPTSGPAGATANAIGSDYPMHTEILILWDGVPLKRPANSGNASTFRIEFHVPTSATTGPHVVTMCVKGSSANACGSPSDDATFTVVPPATPTPIPTATPSPTPTPSPSPTPSPTPVPTPTPFPTPAATPDLSGPSAGPAIPPSSLRLVLAAEALVVLGAGLYLVRARRVAADGEATDELGASQPQG